VSATPISQPRESTASLGSPTNPVLLDPANPEFMDGAFQLYAALRATCPVARARFLPPQGEETLADDPQGQANRSPLASPGMEGWLLTRYDDAVATLLDDDAFSVNPESALTPEQRAAANEDADEDLQLLTRSILILDPPDHTRLRRLVQPWFTGRAIGELRPRIAAIAHELLDAAEAHAAARGEAAPRRTMELVRDYAYPLPVTVISEMLGVSREDRERVQRWTEALTARRGQTLDEAQRESVRAFRDYLQALAARKRVAPGDDLVSFLVNAEVDEDRLDDAELIAMLFLIYVAGHITTVNLIGNAVVALLQHPEQVAVVRADPALARAAVEETLRSWGPVEQVVPRIAKHDVAIEGVAIPARSRVFVSLAASDRDPARFADPDVFDIRRPDANRHIAFGKGIHACLGSPLARAEGEIALATLVQRLPALRLDVPADALVWRPNFFRGFREIPVVF
jgi:cytochrome P450